MYKDRKNLLFLGIILFSILLYNTLHDSPNIEFVTTVLSYGALTLLYLVLFSTSASKLFPSLNNMGEFTKLQKWLGYAMVYLSIMHGYTAFYSTLVGTARLDQLYLLHTLTLLIGVLALVLLNVYSLINSSNSITKPLKLKKYGGWLLYICGYLVLLHVVLVWVQAINLSIVQTLSYILLVCLLSFDTVFLNIKVNAKRRLPYNFVLYTAYPIVCASLFWTIF